MKKSVLVLSLLGLITFGCAKGPSSADKKEIEELKLEIQKLKSVLGAVARVDVDEVYSQIKAQEEAEKKVHNIPQEDSPVWGNPSAKVTIVEFSDFECPYCAMRVPMLQELMQKHPNDIKIVFKNFPLSFHKNSPAAHAAAIAAQKQGKFWEFRFEVTKDARNLKLDSASLVAAAQKVGLDVELFKKDMVLDAAKQAILKRDQELGSQVGVQGTPTYFVNGKQTQKFSPEYIDQLLKTVK